MPNNLLQSKPKIVNIGLAEFAETAEAFGSEALQVEWRPPAQGDSHLNEVLVRLEGHYDQIAKANEAAVAKVLSAQPMWIDVGPALDVIPGFTKNTVLHAGPPVKWEDMCEPMKGAVVGGLIFEGLATTPEDALTVASSGL